MGVSVQLSTHLPHVSSQISYAGNPASQYLVLTLSLDPCNQIQSLGARSGSIRNVWSKKSSQSPGPRAPLKFGDVPFPCVDGPLLVLGELLKLGSAPPPGVGITLGRFEDAEFVVPETLGTLVCPCVADGGSVPATSVIGAIPLLVVGGTVGGAAATVVGLKDGKKLGLASPPPLVLDGALVLLPLVSLFNPFVTFVCSCDADGGEVAPVKVGLKDGITLGLASPPPPVLDGALVLFPFVSLFGPLGMFVCSCEVGLKDGKKLGLAPPVLDGALVLFAVNPLGTALVCSCDTDGGEVAPVGVSLIEGKILGLPALGGSLVLFSPVSLFGPPFMDGEILSKKLEVGGSVAPVAVGPGVVEFPNEVSFTATDGMKLGELL